MPNMQSTADQGKPFVFMVQSRRLIFDNSAMRHNRHASGVSSHIEYAIEERPPSKNPLSSISKTPTRVVTRSVPEDLARRQQEILPAGTRTQSRNLYFVLI